MNRGVIRAIDRLVDGKEMVMRGHHLQKSFVAGLGIALGAALSMAMLSTEARAADVRISVNIGGPPVVLHAPPRLVYLPEPALYVAVGIPYDVYFVGGRYYNFQRGRWYYAPRYGGPWAIAGPSLLPPGLRHYDAVRLRTYRDREYDRIYRNQGQVRYYDTAAGPGRGKGRGHKGGKR